LEGLNVIKPADLIPLASIVAQIRVLCNARSSGIMFLVSEENRMAQVHLSAGEVVGVICRSKRGLAAIKLMRDIHSAHMRFDNTNIATLDSDGLLTEVFFDYLSATHQEDAAPSEAHESGSPLTPDIKVILQKLLAKFIGPMAEIVCLDHFEGATNALRVIDAIANEISNQEDANKFRSDATRAIG
jgi:hypothetical protein